MSPQTAHGRSVARRSAGSPSPTSTRGTEWTSDDLRVGRRPREPDRPRHGRGRGDDIGLRCDMLFRHDTHTQALMPLNVPAVIVVAPAAVEFTDEAEARPRPCLPDRAPRVTGHCSGHLALGTVPDRGPSVRLFNVQGSATRRTTGSPRLGRDRGVVFEVDARTPCRTTVASDGIGPRSGHLGAFGSRRRLPWTACGLVDAVGCEREGCEE